MAIPRNADIEYELLAFLASAPNGRATAAESYDAVAAHFPELTDDELTVPFQRSVSQWANRVQFCRQHLVDEGMIYRAGDGPEPEHGVWIITPFGRECS